MIKKVLKYGLLSVSALVLGYVYGVYRATDALVEDYRGDEETLQKLANKRRINEAEGEEAKKEEAHDILEEALEEARSKDDDDSDGGPSAFQ